MTSIRVSSYYLAGVLAAVWGIGAAQAADLQVTSPVPVSAQAASLPAVSDVNGKVEFSAGALTLPSSAAFRAGGSLTVPLGHDFGIQGDISAANSGAGATYGGALHFFTRDPSSYLVGLTAGVVRSDQGLLGAVGPEAELYLDRWTIEAWAGVAGLNYNDPALADLRGAFAIVDAVYYPTDDFRMSFGASAILGTNSVKFGAEYALGSYGLPLSLTADARYSQDGAFTIMAGLKGYFGGSDTKSLIDRQRQDDPPNRSLDLNGAAGSLLFATSPGEATPPDPEQAICENSDGEWYFNGETYYCRYT